MKILKSKYLQFFLIMCFTLTILSLLKITDIKIRTIFFLTSYIIFGIIYILHLHISDLEKEKKLQGFSPYSETLSKLTTILIFSILIYPAIIYNFILIISYLEPIFYIVSNLDTWIGFFGSILGGTLSLLAIVYAFNLQKIQRELELDRTQVPKLSIFSNIPKNSDDNQILKIVYNDNTDSIIMNFGLNLTNFSCITAQKIDLQLCDYIVYNPFIFSISNREDIIEKYDLSEKVNLKLKELDTIFGDYSTNISIPLNIKKEYVNLTSEEYLHDLKFIVLYKSQFAKITYQLETIITFSIEKLKKDIRNLNTKGKYSEYTYLLKIIDTRNKLGIKNNS